MTAFFTACLKDTKYQYNYQDDRILFRLFGRHEISDIIIKMTALFTACLKDTKYQYNYQDDRILFRLCERHEIPI